VSAVPRATDFAPLPRRFFARGAVAVARDLMGRVLVHQTRAGLCAGIIVEAEAYDESDPASHCYNGPTARNRTMYGPPGHLYVYRSYGVHWCCNVVTGGAGVGAAVLLRAVEPIAGLPIMQRRRFDGADGPLRDLARGPGRLCAAMGITRDHDGVDTTEPPLWIGRTPGRFSRPTLRTTPRIGISKAVSRPWRFCVAGSPFVSGPKRLR